MPKLSIDQLQLKDKKVLTRVDFNVPLDARQHITDDRRIKAALPTIERILTQGGKPVLMSHLGRPRGQVIKELSLSPVAIRLGELLGRHVLMAEDCVGPEVERLVAGMNSGDVLLLENLRFHAGETDNDLDFARQLAALGDIYVDDAFGSAHRAHASTEGVARFFREAAAGYLMQKELDYLGRALTDPARPFGAVLGGAKVAGKIDVIRNFMPKVDLLLIGGGMAFTFLKARGLEVGKSLLEEDKVGLAAGILREAEKYRLELHLPVDCLVAADVEPTAATKVVAVEKIPKDWCGVDIGPETTKSFVTQIAGCKTVVWNGPMGVFEMPPFSGGTTVVAEALADVTRSGGITIVGGGDSAAAVVQAGLEDRVSHISTGGGASLEFLAGKALPGVEILTEKA